MWRETTTCSGQSPLNLLSSCCLKKRVFAMICRIPAQGYGSEGIYKGSGRGQTAQHEANGGDLDMSYGRLHAPLKILGQAPPVVEPAEGALHHPAAGHHLKALAMRRCGHDFPCAVAPTARVLGQRLAGVARSPPCRVDRAVPYAPADPRAAPPPGFDGLAVPDGRRGCGTRSCPLPAPAVARHLAVHDRRRAHLTALSLSDSVTFLMYQSQLLVNARILLICQQILGSQRGRVDTQCGGRNFGQRSQPSGFGRKFALGRDGIGHYIHLNARAQGGDGARQRSSKTTASDAATPSLCSANR